ncbi:hypothetical protein [Thiothrix nivea]|uniref:Abortive infection protein-like C-terminal domain-containing protein n=1 Tax=Thiothrix nivea (strain ATCC 35100 / DSM 5205 / JP2) TaxID=870187 RepID=A0A656HJ71_THINJ|nr:hypothetical protein [Thiothrix nivea]EIJ36968.1 hypothetical protein Thini_4494 [Thiothrix nivea DSM 5205]
MTPTINSVWNAVSAILKDHFSFYDIKQVIGLAGFDLESIADLEQERGVSKGKLITGITQGYSNFSEHDKKHFINIIVEEILDQRPHLFEKLEKYLSRLGWEFSNGSVIPIEIFDISDLPELHEKSKEDLIKASLRFRDGDLSGAISSACAAVDNVTAHIYSKYNLGDVGKASFQEKCKVAIKNIKLFEEVDNQLKSIGWTDSSTSPFNKNFEGSLNQAAYVMQTLRANMSDVHGTKPVLRPLVFDSIKWAEILVRVLSDK